MLRAAPLAALRLTYSFISRDFARDARRCREVFFSPALEEEALQRHMSSIAGSGEARLLDLRALSAQLPVPPPRRPPPALVMGSDCDAVVDAGGVAEAAAAWGVAPTLLSGIGHDLMLDAGWRAAAERVAGWLETLEAASAPLVRAAE